MWNAERTDRALMEEIKSSKHAIGNVGRTIKNLLAGCDDQLKKTRAAYTAARVAHYELTLPWVSNPKAERQSGPRLLPSMLFDKYMLTMGALRRTALTELDKLVYDYPGLVTQAQANLGGMADAQDYPTPEWVREAFQLSFDFQPIPPAGAFKGLGIMPDTLEKLGKALMRKQAQAAQSAQAAMWSNVRERVSHLVDRLAQPDAKFKRATVEQVRELVELMPGWNVTSQVGVTELVEDIKNMLANVDAEDIRKDARLRADVATQASRITDKLNQWGV
jgi:hypothetical protein